VSLVLTIVEGIAGVVVCRAEEIDSNRGGVLIETSALATRVVGLVITGPHSTTSAGEHELVIIAKLVVTRVGDVEGAEIGSLVALRWIPSCSTIDMAGGADAASSVTIKSPIEDNRRWITLR